MNFRTVLLVVAASVLLQACASTTPVARNPSVEPAPGPELAWGRLHMDMPAGWVMDVREDGSEAIARSQVSDEDVRVMQFGSKPEHANETPAQHLQRYIGEQSPPDPDAPEVKDVVPYTPFAMPGGEPATMRMQDIGGEQLVVEYAMAFPGGEMYTINFYRTGNSESAVRQYSDIVRHARFASGSAAVQGSRE